MSKSNIWTWLIAFGRGLGRILKSALTGPDGSSWAPGRIMGFALFSICQGLVIRATRDVLTDHPAIGDWCIFFSGISAFEGAICATAIGLVLGMAPTDSGGRWWTRDGSPPPPGR